MQVEIAGVAHLVATPGRLQVTVKFKRKFFVVCPESNLIVGFFKLDINAIGAVVKVGQ